MSARQLVLVAVVLLLAAGAWPYVALLDTWPRAPDSVEWILRGSPRAQGWREWVFETRQFNVGYRPLMALSFTLTEALGAEAAWVYRWTDLALHLGAGLLVFLLARVLELPRPAALVALAVFLVLPCAEDVVPYLARRSYSLGSCLSLAALVLSLGLPRAAAGEGRSASKWALSVFVAGLLVLALFTHEASLVAVVALPALHATRPGGARPARLASTCLVPLVCVAVAWFVRAEIVGGLGGYDAVEAERAARALPIAAAALRGLVFPSGVAGGGAGLEWALGLASLALLVEVLRGARRGVGLVAFLGLVGYVLAYALQGVWFDRQAYFMAVPAGLFVAAAATPASGAATSRRSAALVAVFLTLVLLHSPVLLGLEQPRLSRWLAQNEVTQGLIDATADLEPGEVAYLVLPYEPGEGELDEEDLRSRKERRDLSRLDRAAAKFVAGRAELGGRTLEELVYYAEAAGSPRYERVGERHWIVLPGGAPYQERQGRGFRRHESESAGRVLVPLQAGAVGRLLLYAQGSLEQIDLNAP